MAASLDRILPRVVRPARYTGGEWNSIVKDWQGHLHVALVYPDVYEEGICDCWTLTLYDALNREDDVLCERAYLPWPDMDEALRGAGLPLYALESRRPLVDFDVLLVVLPGELHFPAVLTILELAGLPLRSRDRNQAPAVVGVGPCTANPEPLAGFFDGFIIGETDGRHLRECVEAFRSDSAVLPNGLYVPGRYQIVYRDDNTVAAITPPNPACARWPETLPPALTRPIVPFVEASRERAVVELAHPAPYPWATVEGKWGERPVDDVLANAEAVLRSTGYDHVQFLGTHRHLDEIAASLSARYAGQHVHFSLGHLSTTPQAVDQADRLPHIRRGTLTFDLVAAREGLRRMHGGSGSDEDVLAAARLAFHRGWHQVRFLAKVGLPTETMDDVQGMVGLARAIRDIGREEIEGRAQVQVVTSPFFPRAHSPWQRNGLPVGEDWAKRVQVLERGVRGPGLRLVWRGLSTWLVEAALARGDRRLAGVIESVWQAGMRRPQDAESRDAWAAAFAAEGLDMAFYGSLARPADEILPWAHTTKEHETDAKQARNR